MSKVGKTTIYTGNIIAKNCWKQGEKEHPVELPRDVQYSWRRGNILRFITYNRESTGKFLLSGNTTFTSGTILTYFFQKSPQKQQVMLFHRTGISSHHGTIFLFSLSHPTKIYSPFIINHIS